MVDVSCFLVGRTPTWTAFALLMLSAACVGAFGLVFLGYSLGTLWDFDLSHVGLPAVLGLSGALLPGWIYQLLTPGDRGVVRGTIDPGVHQGIESRMYHEVCR